MKQLTIESKGQVVCKEGQEADFIYIVKSGEFTISRKEFSNVFVDLQTGTIKIVCSNAGVIHSQTKVYSD